MENKKTPEMWFQKLKEPYRSEAIAGINKNVTGFKEYPESLEDALFHCLYWNKTCNPTRNDWDVIYNSIIAGETPYLEPETLTPEQKNSSSFIDIESVQKRSKEMFEKTLKEFNSLKPEQMESGKWYVVETAYLWIIKFDKIKDDRIYGFKGINFKGSFIDNEWNNFIEKIQSIRPATNEEVLKYFPDEKFEPIELKPKETDWKAKYNELKNMYLNLSLINDEFTEIYNELNAKFDALADKYTKLEAYNDELTERINKFEMEETEQQVTFRRKHEDLLEAYDILNKQYDELKAKYDQLEPKGEKVYFYTTDLQGWDVHFEFTDSLEKALNFATSETEVFEAIKLGKKKSVLVSE